MTYTVSNVPGERPHILKTFSASSGEIFEAKIYPQAIISGDVSVDLSVLEDFLAACVDYIKSASQGVSLVSFESEDIVQGSYTGLQGYDEVAAVIDDVSQIWMYVDLNYETILEEEEGSV